MPPGGGAGETVRAPVSMAPLAWKTAAVLMADAAAGSAGVLRDRPGRAKVEWEAEEAEIPRARFPNRWKQAHVAYE